MVVSWNVVTVSPLLATQYKNSFNFVAMITYDDLTFAILYTVYTDSLNYQVWEVAYKPKTYLIKVKRWNCLFCLKSDDSKVINPFVSTTSTFTPNAIPVFSFSGGNW